MNIGYCCINTTLRKNDVYSGRNVIRRNFSLQKASDLALKNTQDILTILEWNQKHNINTFRIGSNIFPRMTDKFCEYRFDDLKTHKQVANTFSFIGKYAHNNKMILSCHPNPYTVLCSEREEVVENSIKEIKMHYLFYELLRQNCDNIYFNINFHIGSKFSQENADRFCKAFESLPENIQNIISIENDDKKNCWSIYKLFNYIYKRVGVKLTFDLHHSKFSREDDMTEYDEFKLAKESCGGKLQEVHMSSGDTRKHLDYVHDEIPKYLIDDNIYILFEAKQKELAVINYKKENNECFF